MTSLDKVFLANVHPPAPSDEVKMISKEYYGDWVETKETLVVRYAPMALRPLHKVRELALAHPEAFLRAVSLVHVTGKRELCPSVLEGKPCQHKKKCPHAGSMAELYANQIHLNPKYKTKMCSLGDRCRIAQNCLFAHHGDVMRKVTKVATQLRNI